MEHKHQKNGNYSDDLAHDCGWAFERGEGSADPKEVTCHNNKSDKQEDAAGALGGVVDVVLDESLVDLVSSIQHQNNLVKQEDGAKVFGHGKVEVVEE